MSSKTFSLVAGIIFSLVAICHLLRLVFGWPMIIAGWTVPLWLSFVGLIISGFLGYQGIKLSKQP